MKRIAFAAVFLLTLLCTYMVPAFADGNPPPTCTPQGCCKPSGCR